MNFKNILFNEITEVSEKLPIAPPDNFSDLNLDQIINEISAGWQEYNLNSFFYFPLKRKDEIYYRHNVFRDLEDEKIYNKVKLFAERMRKVRSYLIQVEKFYYQQQKEIWFLYAAEIYCDAVIKFKEDLSVSECNSEGFKKLREYLVNYCSNNNFKSLEDEIKNIKDGLSKIKYQVIIQQGAFTVQDYEPGTDYSKEIEKTFDKFSRGDEFLKTNTTKNYTNGKFRDKTNHESGHAEMNHIEAKIIEFVSYLYPDAFSRLKNFNSNHSQFIDKTISNYDREIHFYISYLEHIKKFKTRGLKFCYPVVSNQSKEIYNNDGFDLALAQKLLEENSKIVCNDFYLKGDERIIVVTGPNQGGKTTFARMFGQLHYLASLGCPTPGSSAKLFLADNIFTQFEREEKVENQKGKLEEDLTRVRSILGKATSDSIIIMNEIFNSTSLQDMTFLSKKILRKISELEAICVWVTFIDELTNYNGKTVSMTSMIVPENPALRTFKILRRPSDGLAYAFAIAEKYKIKQSDILKRIKK